MVPDFRFQNIGNGFRATQMAQAFFQIQTKVFDVDGDSMAGRGQIHTHLNIGGAKAPSPFRNNLT